MSHGKRGAYLKYPRDFAADEHVMRMTLEAEGAYNRLLDHQWLHGSVPADLPGLAVVCKGIHTSRMKALWTMISPCFVPMGNDPARLVNQKMERVRISDQKYSKGQSRHGKKGADKRWGSPSQAHDNPPPTTVPAVEKLARGSVQQSRAASTNEDGLPHQDPNGVKWPPVTALKAVTTDGTPVLIPRDQRMALREPSAEDSRMVEIQREAATMVDNGTYEQLLDGHRG